MKETFVFKNDVTAREVAGRDLVKKGSEGKVVVLADEKDLEATFQKFFRCVDAAEATADNNYRMFFHTMRL